MSPSKAIASLDNLVGEFAKLVEELREEGRKAKERWDALGRFGGQRDDHAAALLGDVRHVLGSIRSHAAVCVDQIDKMQADPFAEE